MSKPKVIVTRKWPSEVEAPVKSTLRRTTERV